jgi:hypothetical protein
VTTERVDDTHPSDEDRSPRPTLLPSCDPLPKSSHNEAGVAVMATATTTSMTTKPTQRTMMRNHIL